MGKRRIKFYSTLSGPEEDQIKAYLKLSFAERLQRLFTLRRRFYPPAELKGPKIKFRKPFDL